MLTDVSTIKFSRLHDFLSDRLFFITDGLVIKLENRLPLHSAPPIIQHFQRENLLDRHAALMAISAVGEGCHKQMEPILSQIIEGVLTFLQDQVSKLSNVYNCR